MSGVRTYILSVVASGFLTALVLSLVTQPRIRKVVRFGCGCFLILVVLTPIYKADFTGMKDYLYDVGLSSRNLAEQAEEKNQKLLADIIAEQAEDAILRQCKALGVEPTVTVTVVEDEALGYPVPYEVLLEGSFTEAVKSKLQTYLAEEWNIPVERQNWRNG